MRIENGLTIAFVSAVRGARPRAADDAQEGPDAPVFSRHAADIKIALDALKDTPEVREDQVEELRAQIEEGTFRVDEQALAEKLLGQSGA